MQVLRAGNVHAQTTSELTGSPEGWMMGSLTDPCGRIQPPAPPSSAETLPSWWGGSFGIPALCPAVRESCVMEEEEESR